MDNQVHAYIPLIDVEIPIIADDSVDMDFGEGALKVTPAHDHLDFEIGERHDLPMITMLGKDGKLSNHNRVPSELHGLSVASARKKVVEMLENIGSLVDSKKHKSSVGISQRSGSVIEPMLSEQWFLKKEPLTCWKMGLQVFTLKDGVGFMAIGGQRLKIGAYLDNCGGGIKYPHGIAKVTIQEIL